ncbi:MAG TPA: NADH-quinone oxidoreductase subunit H [Bacilli bacterium]
METILLQTAQIVLLVLFAPILTGVIKKTKALLQGRKGPAIMQTYYDLRKFMRKDAVVSKEASWIFTATPYVVFGATLAVTALIPVVSDHALLSFTGDFVLVVYLFALARFFLAMSGVDTGSSFGAMGSSRDMFISMLAEPVLFITVLVMAIPAQTLNLSAMVKYLATGGQHITPAYFMMILAFVMLLVTETGRVPVDNPDTHLELTMIHEGTLLEYSGKQLALLVWGSSLKQIILFALFADLCFPWGVATEPGLGPWLLGLVLLLLKMVGVGILLASVEMSYAKMRLFKVPRYLAAAFLLSLFALVTEFLL